MIPILYAAVETDFTHNGIGALRDASKCVVTEERNGGFVLELEYPVSGAMYEYIQEDCVIKAKPNDTAKNQLFRIYSSSKPKSGFVTFLAEHISYELSGNPIESVSFSNRNAAGALSAVLGAALLPHNYEVQSDIETLNSTALSRVSVRAALGGIKGSILDTYGGEYEFDNFIIKLHAHRGSNTGIKIAYGKNITDIKQEKNISAVYTAVYPYARYTPETEEGSEEQPEEVVVTISEKILYSPHAPNYARVRVCMKDFTDAFDDGEIITEERLRAKAQSWVNTSGFDVPSVNITVSFINLWQTPEYAKYAILERVNLCDTVTVEYSKLGITAEAKVIKTKYDALKEKYISLELGNARANFADTVNQTTASVESVKNEIKKQAAAVNIAFAQAIAKATAAITGQSGGYVVLNPSENPQEILVLDAPNVETAVNVWRWNVGGLGHSNNGYNGPFELALTADGEFNANFITIGTIKGELIEAGSIRANAISTAYKSEITSEIQGAAAAVEQAFVAADEQLRSLIQSVSSSFANGIEEAETKISQILQTIENLTFSFSNQYTGGINYIANSSGLNGVSDDWSYTGTVQALQDTDIKSNTFAGTCFWLGPATTLSQEIEVMPGTAYTLTFKMKKAAVRGWVKIISGGNEIEVVNTNTVEDWTEHTITFITPSNTVTLEIYAYANYLYIADIMLSEGTTKQRWTPAPNEIYTTDVKIDRRGIHITNTESKTNTIINNVEFAVLYRETKVITVNKDTTVLTKVMVKDELTVGKLKIIPVEGGVDEVLLD